jgi:antitoxin (DNA-binding transcriptional repressor) of toxin-antitoxin stability system
MEAIAVSEFRAKLMKVLRQIEAGSTINIIS